ncbi:hypothetical protein CMO91_05430 [Candidatus Woesearchaeota archaeon]|nr:hypothetical protein [Candidatus Woesearchaeota archaeon]|tara:strand:+ start:308 stop:1198 length:891 start_codon:yes stop_codon:yes gene_type:complete
MPRLILALGLLAAIGCSHTQKTEPPRLEQRILSQTSLLGKNLTYGVVASRPSFKYPLWVERNAASMQDGRLVYINLDVLKRAAKKLFIHEERLERNFRNPQRLNKLAKDAREEGATSEFFSAASEFFYWRAWRAFHKKHKEDPNREQWFVHYCQEVLLHRELAYMAAQPRRIERLSKTKIPDWVRFLESSTTAQYKKQNVAGLLYSGTRDHEMVSMSNFALSQMCKHLDKRIWRADAEESPEYRSADAVLTMLDDQLPGDRYEAAIALAQMKEHKQQEALFAVGKRLGLELSPTYK